MKKALFAGTFYPPTLGHLDIIERASKLCDKLYVAIAENTDKAAALLSMDERKKMLKTMTKGIKNIEVVSFPTLVVQYAKENGIEFLIRSIRNNNDLGAEYSMAAANKLLTGIETVFLMADPCYGHIQSKLVREIAFFGGSLENFVPAEIERTIRNKLRKS